MEQNKLLLHCICFHCCIIIDLLVSLHRHVRVLAPSTYRQACLLSHVCVLLVSRTASGILCLLSPTFSHLVVEQANSAAAEGDENMRQQLLAASSLLSRSEIEEEDP